MRTGIVIPTYKRPEQLTKLLDSIAVAAVPAMTVYCYVSPDDWGLEKYGNLYSAPWLEWYTYDREFRAAEFWNAHLQRYGIRDDITIYLCDDTELLPDTLRAARIEYTSHFPNWDGVIGIKQENLHGKCETCPAAFGIIGQEFLKQFPDKRVFCEDYGAFYLDTELYEYANWAGRFYFSHRAKLIHHHPVSGVPMDATYQHNRRWQQSDRLTRKLRQHHGYMWGRDFTLVRQS